MLKEFFFNFHGIGIFSSTEETGRNLKLCGMIIDTSPLTAQISCMIVLPINFSRAEQ